MTFRPFAAGPPGPEDSAVWRELYRAYDNYRARGKYDQVADRTMWVTYDL